jgi:predicted NBD/HSP70 family sugar kinase
MTDVLAVDLGGTKSTFARVNEQGTVRERHKQPAARTVAESVAQIADAARDAAAIGVIVPGIYTAPC